MNNNIYLIELLKKLGIGKEFLTLLEYEEKTTKIY